MTIEDDQLRAEMAYLAMLARTEPLAGESPIEDGGALVIPFKGLEAEMIIEVRLPGTTEFITGDVEGDGRLLVYLQNLSDQPLNVRWPEFMWTAGLVFPWHAGIELMTNPYRGELVEVLSLQTHITGRENLRVLASDLLEIARKCRTIASRNAVP